MRRLRRKRRTKRRPAEDPRVEQLFRSQYPYDEYQDHDASRPNYISSREVENTHDEMDAYQRMLTKLPQPLLQLLYNQNRESQKRSEQNRIDEAWDWYCLTDKEAAPDLTFWQVMESWSIEEAVALAINIDPQRVDERSAITREEVSEPARRYLRLLELASRAKLAGSLSDPTLPSAFVEWAKRHPQLVSTNFTSAAPIDEVSSASLKSQLERLRKEHKELSIQNRTMRQAMKSLQVIAVATAKKNGGFVPGDRDVITPIVKACEDLDRDLDRGTIKNALEKAYKEVMQGKPRKSGS